MSVIDNRTAFSTVEFDSWANRTRLIPAESFLIQCYLEKELRTLEAGVGGGKILLAMKQLGFRSLYGFDYVPALVSETKNKDVDKSIGLNVGDAVRLSYPDRTFDQIIYLQQVLCFVEEQSDRIEALKEAYRILKPGGTALFSFLCFEGRGLTHRAYSVYLRFLRALSRSLRSQQSTPWLRLGGKFNFAALRDRGPYIYWYKVEEITSLLHEAGFETIAIGSTHQIKQQHLRHRPAALLQDPIEGMLYVVGRKT